MCRAPRPTAPGSCTRPYREIGYGKPGGAETETLTYYDTVDGMPFAGRAGELTLGLPTRVTVAVSATDPPIATARLLYDANGMVTASLDPNGTPGDLTAHLRTYGYDADGLRPVVVDMILQRPQAGAQAPLRRALQPGQLSRPIG